MTPSTEQLMAALPHILAAPKTGTTIDHICFRPARNERSFPTTMPLTRAEGTPGGRWQNEPWLRLPDGSPDPDIQVSILPLRVLNLVWQPGDPSPHPGDTFVADLDTSLANLPPGSLLRAGSATLRVSSLFNDACVKWKARYGAAAKDWITAPNHPELRLRGILCAVVEDGIITNGDPVIKL